jgi:hypothetical protein
MSRKRTALHNVRAHTRSGRPVRAYVSGTGLPKVKPPRKMTKSPDYLSKPRDYYYDLARDMISNELDNDPKDEMRSMGWLSNSKYGKLPKSAFDYIEHNIDSTLEDTHDLADILRDKRLGDVMDAYDDNEVSDFTADMLAEKYNKLLAEWRKKGKNKRYVKMKLERSVPEGFGMGGGFGGSGAGVNKQASQIGTAYTPKAMQETQPIKTYSGPWAGPPRPIPEQKSPMKTIAQETPASRMTSRLVMVHDGRSTGADIIVGIPRRGTTPVGATGPTQMGRLSGAKSAIEGSRPISKSALRER